MQRSNAATRRLQILETDTREALASLAGRVHRLCPDHRDPHRFHEEKSEIANELAQLARKAR
ncbi:hypothetical protein SAMN05216376_11226 [Mameliella alba]|uniref:hypothetical protein n=1 Tax=Mameliella alba TaxID=561184 RepID=UPI00088057EC|nr:hypothetical protein [Mameliella alba]PTR36996.1 hypothetical protein LX94_03788 [Mameliella alba]GGF77068.1 hypothetical protein GCM10011319_41790 [Mameliella alba]SDD81484.1 hypothetical protein SAMN05216376_11226 [Mameliella alba]